MSISQLQEEQRVIKEEQQAIKKELQLITQKLDSTLRGDLRRIVSRMEESEKRLERISGGLADTSDGMLREKGSRQIQRPSLGGHPGLGGGGSPRSSVSNFRAAAPNARVSDSLGGSSRGLGAATRPSLTKRKPTEDNLAVAKAMITNAVKQAAKDEVWEQSGPKESPAATDRVENLLRTAFERTKEFKKNGNNPIEAVAAIFRRIDQNHSGKIDLDELELVCKKVEFPTDKGSLRALLNRYDVDNNRCLSIEEFTRFMFKRDGDQEYKAKSAIARMREVLTLRAGGFEGLRALGTQFRIIDRDHSGRLSKEEFSVALDCLFSAYGVKFTPAEKNSLMGMFDREKTGDISYDEFVRGVRGDMNDFRLDFVKQAFSILDRDGSGVVQTGEIAQIYDVSQNPAVKSGKVSAQDAINQLLKHYDENGDGQIGFEEFQENYEWVSSSIDNDDYFELMMRNAWHIAGGSTWCENTANLRVLVQHTRGADEVYELHNDMGLPSDPKKKIH